MAIPLTSLEPIEAAIRRQPFGLLCDVDGTLSPMAATPGDAAVTPRNLSLIEALSKRAVVAAISGRDLPDLRRMVDVAGVACVGLHGLAWWIDGRQELEADAEPFVALTQQAAAELDSLRRLGGILIETKTVGLAIHFRRVVNTEAARDLALAAIAASPAASRFNLHEGILLLELRPPLGMTKGVALRRLVERFGLRGLLFLGDDITDVDAFLEARRLRDSGTVEAYGIAVVHSEAPAEAAETADFSVRDVSGVERLLAQIDEALRDMQPAGEGED